MRFKLKQLHSLIYLVNVKKIDIQIIKQQNWKQSLSQISQFSENMIGVGIIVHQPLNLIRLQKILQLQKITMNSEQKDFEKFIITIYCILIRTCPFLSQLLIPPLQEKYHLEQFKQFPFYIQIEKRNKSRSAPELEIQNLIEKAQDLWPFVCDQEILEAKQKNNQIQLESSLQFDLDSITHDTVMYLPIITLENDMLINNAQFCDQSHYFTRYYKDQIPPQEVVSNINITKFQLVLIFWQIKLLLEEKLNQDITIHLLPIEYNFYITIKIENKNILYFFNEQHKLWFMTQNFEASSDAYKYDLGKLFENETIKYLEMPLFKIHSLDDAHFLFGRKLFFFPYNEDKIGEERDFPFIFSPLCESDISEFLFHKIRVEVNRLPQCCYCGKIIEEQNYNQLLVDPQLLGIFQRFQEIIRFKHLYLAIGSKLTSFYLKIFIEQKRQIAGLFNNKQQELIRFIFNPKVLSYDLAVLNKIAYQQTETDSQKSDDLVKSKEHFSPKGNEEPDNDLSESEMDFNQSYFKPNIEPQVQRNKRGEDDELKQNSYSNDSFNNQSDYENQLQSQENQAIQIIKSQWQEKLENPQYIMQAECNIFDEYLIGYIGVGDNKTS